MPRRYADYRAVDGFTTLNTISSIGSFILGASTLPFLYNVYITAKRGKRVTVDDPWATAARWSGPRPAAATPQLHLAAPHPLESPAFDLHHPEVAALDLGHGHGKRAVAATSSGGGGCHRLWFARFIGFGGVDRVKRPDRLGFGIVRGGAK